MARGSIIQHELLYTNPHTNVKIFRGVMKQTVPVAVKEQYHDSLEGANRALMEAMTMASLEDSGVVKLYDAYLQEGQDGQIKTVLVMELMERGLMEEIREREIAGKHWTESELLTYLQILTAILCVAKSQSISHRDIKPSNIFLHEGSLKLGDFGSSALQLEDSEEPTSLQGTLTYMSPEMRRKYTSYLMEEENQEVFDQYQADVFSLGATFLTMMKLNEPPELTEPVCESDKLFALLTSLCEYRFLQALLFHMLDFDPESRITFESLSSALEHHSNPILPSTFSLPAQSCASCNGVIASVEWQQNVYEYPPNTRSFCSLACYHLSLQMDSACLQCGEVGLDNESIVLQCGHCFHTRACLFSFLQAESRKFSLVVNYCCTQCRGEITPQFLYFSFGGQVEYERRVTEVYNQLCCKCYNHQGNTYFPKCGHRSCRHCLKTVFMIYYCPVCGIRSHLVAGSH